MAAPYQLSFQLYSTRNFPPQEAVLAELARIGYDAVEPWLPDFGDDPKAFRRRIDDAGLACLGFHMPFKGLVNEPQRFIDIAHTIGARLMIPPTIVADERPTEADGWRRIGDALRKGGEAAKAEGLQVVWHNHAFDFATLPDGSRPIDLMLGTAGDIVGFEIDFAWITRAECDPVTELKRFAPRIAAIQVKDTAPLGTVEEGGWAATGDGIVDWASLFPLFGTTPADHLVVEHDNPADWQRVAQRSYDFMIAMGARGTGTA